MLPSGPYRLHRNCLHTQRRIPAVGLFALLVVVSGCSSQEKPHPTPPDIRGVVTGIIPANDQMRSRGLIAFLRIEGKGDSGVRYDRADVSITDTTKIYSGHDSDLKPAEFSMVSEGTHVEGNFVGPVLERYPVHATAGKLVIVVE